MLGRLQAECPSHDDTALKALLSYEPRGLDQRFSCCPLDMKGGPFGVCSFVCPQRSAAERQPFLQFLEKGVVINLLQSGRGKLGEAH